MRLKEFLIAVAIFTVVYFGFFGIIDRIIDSNGNKRYKKSVKSQLSIENYLKFARFYGIQSSLTLENILNIHTTFSTLACPAKISAIANNFSISQYELIVVYLFFEYLGLLPKKTFMFDTDMISNTNMIDSNLVNKYNQFFINRKSIDEIIRLSGGNTYNDIVHLNSLFLVPGVRFVNNQLYYVGDFNENS